MRAAQRSAWVVIDDAHQAWTVGRALQDAGWNLSGIANGMKGARDLLRCVPHTPDVVVTGLRFQDGDGLQLVRLLGGLPAAPSIFIASHQQRAVIKAAVALAQASAVPVVGVAEQPVDAQAIAATLGRVEFKTPRRAAQPRPQELSVDEVRALMAQGAIAPWLQPKVRVDTCEVVGFEALMRAQDAEGRLITPDRLIGPLAAGGLLDQASMQMARQTIDFVGHCLSEGMAISASINISMQSLANFGFCQELVRAVDAIELDPSWITIEITESETMCDLAQVIENTARIRMLGFNLAIDDFGTAYSSFFQLSQIPFSELKIERAFVTGLGEDPARQAIVRACAQLGSSLGLQVVAEGVENASELAAVRQCGCSQVQGYLVSRPMPPQLAFDWLRQLDNVCVPLPA
ncbi:EAL domain-containing response regulator [Piscinibacter terrae]|uniref:EAL domain-containing protein n=1 Tax=Piscinibacter terrae TaxID=2496871 RepID=A0A3N7HIQ1_9BURK|nr:EAL domain-containing response regulator [Albitalea terrae]RQP21917.1 EAL domain-containing protein [Albitalea terrae]